MKIVIYSPSFEEASGGVIVLHKLCDILIKQGFNAGFYIEDNVSFYVNTGYKYNYFKLNEIDLENDIVVYPEITYGNPLMMKKVVRYILYTHHITGNRVQTWGNNDYWIYYSSGFYDGIKPKIILNISDSKLDYFKDYNLDRPYKECFTYRKSHNNIDDLNILHSSDAIEFGFNQSDSYLISLFNSCERFYCYDTNSYLNVLASLCGCDSIIVPNKYSKKEQILSHPAFKYGIAYGISGIEYAKKTRHKLRKYLIKKEENQNIETKKIFINIINYYENNI